MNTCRKVVSCMRDAALDNMCFRFPAIPDEEANGIRNVPGTQHPDALVNCFERYITKLRDSARNK